MKFTYDSRYNIAYIRFKEKNESVESIRLSDDLVVDISKDGKVYGIELLNANEQLCECTPSGKKGYSGKIEFINEATGEKTELSLAI